MDRCTGWCCATTTSIRCVRRSPGLTLARVRKRPIWKPPSDWMYSRRWVPPRCPGSLPRPFAGWPPTNPMCSRRPVTHFNRRTGCEHAWEGRSSPNPVTPVARCSRTLRQERGTTTPSRGPVLGANFCHRLSALVPMQVSLNSPGARFPVLWVLRIPPQRSLDSACRSVPDSLRSDQVRRLSRSSMNPVAALHVGRICSQQPVSRLRVGTGSEPSKTQGSRFDVRWTG